MGKVTVVGGKVGMEAPVTFDPVFANNTWGQIIEACQKNKVPDTWVVGDSKSMTINGTNYTIDVIGKNHDVYSDGSGKAPLTFQMHDCYGTTTYQMNLYNSNETGWTSSYLRSTVLPSLLALMPSEVQSGIREVSKKTSAGKQSSTINTTSDKLFLLAEIEVFEKTFNSKSGEGSQYAYYKAGNSKVKRVGGTASHWWLRSPCATNSTGFCVVLDSGSYGQHSGNSSRGVAFAFCF